MSDADQVVSAQELILDRLAHGEMDDEALSGREWPAKAQRWIDARAALDFLVAALERTERRLADAEELARHQAREIDDFGRDLEAAERELDEARKDLRRVRGTASEMGRDHLRLGAERDCLKDALERLQLLRGRDKTTIPGAVKFALNESMLSSRAKQQLDRMGIPHEGGYVKAGDVAALIARRALAGSGAQTGGEE